MFYYSTQPDEVDQHPEKRMKAAYKKYEETNLPILKQENPNMKLSQLKQMLWKDWQKSSENPLNQRLAASWWGHKLMDLVQGQVLRHCCYLYVCFCLFHYPCLIKSLTVKESNFSNGALSPPLIYRESCPLFTRNWIVWLFENRNFEDIPEV